MSDYEINVMLEMEAMRYKKTYNTHKVLVTNRAWVENAHGSSEPACVRMERVYEAYAEYRASEMWG